MDQYGKDDCKTGSARRKLRVLVVDDHSDSARALSRLLSNSGYDVKVAHDVATALHLAAESPIDLLVSDISLPDGTGLDLIRTLRRATPIKGIALSGHSGADAVKKSQDAGFSVHLAKPVDFDELRKTLDALAGG
ncbi:MAG: sensor hybrid histidine kinase [Phycisphaerales bacterium]|jgi:CheY-like chemotaxis protein|nr:sensor hybrid histidine kinase [Phycisphaerales bacterium]MDB5302831.1 sensor hybrid histidine kinase [Phycisphaerales bacterium]